MPCGSSRLVSLVAVEYRGFGPGTETGEARVTQEHALGKREPGAPALGGGRKARTTRGRQRRVVGIPDSLLRPVLILTVLVCQEQPPDGRLPQQELERVRSARGPAPGLRLHRLRQRGEGGLSRLSRAAGQRPLGCRRPNGGGGLRRGQEAGLPSRLLGARGPHEGLHVAPDRQARPRNPEEAAGRHRPPPAAPRPLRRPEPRLSAHGTASSGPRRARRSARLAR